MIQKINITQFIIVLGVLLYLINFQNLFAQTKNFGKLFPTEKSQSINWDNVSFGDTLSNINQEYDIISGAYKEKVSSGSGTNTKSSLSQQSQGRRKIGNLPGYNVFINDSLNTKVDKKTSNSSTDNAKYFIVRNKKTDRLGVVFGDLRVVINDHYSFDRFLSDYPLKLRFNPLKSKNNAVFRVININKVTEIVKKLRSDTNIKNVYFIVQEKKYRAL